MTVVGLFDHFGPVVPVICEARTERGIFRRSYYNHLSIERPLTPGLPGNYTSQYFEEANGPLYPFGYGLSYTEFSLSDVTLSARTMNSTGKLTASIALKNTGTREGETVIQLYIQDVSASMSRPVMDSRAVEQQSFELL